MGGSQKYIAVLITMFLIGYMTLAGKGGMTFSRDFNGKFDILILGLAIIFFIFNLRHRKAHREAMRRYARRIGAELEDVNTNNSILGFAATNFGSIKGVKKDVAFKIFTRVEGHGKNARTYTVFRTILKDAPKGFCLDREHFLGLLLRVVGVRDIQVGIEELDKYFVISGLNESEVKRYFTRDKGRIFKTIFEDHHTDGIRVTNRRLEFKYRDLFTEESRIDECLNAIVNATLKLS